MLLRTTSSAPFVSLRAQADPWREVRRLKKGGCRISFTLRPALLPSRNGAMTPFPMSAGVAAHPKVKRRPPFSAPPSPRAAMARSAGVIVGGSPGGIGGGSGTRPRFASIAHLAWWDGVSHAVTRPGPRARHSTREHVTQPASTYPKPASTSLNPRARHSGRRARGLSDVLGGYPTISRTAAPGAAAPRTPRCAFRTRERRSDRRGPAERKWSKESATMSPLNNLRDPTPAHLTGPQDMSGRSRS